MANYFKTLAKRVPKYLSDTLLKPPTALDWTSKQAKAGRFDRRAEEMDITSSENKSEKQQEKSYLSAAVESISPWNNLRSSTLKPASAAVPGEGSGLKNQHGGDHTTQHWHGLSLKRYPSDCPPLNARWFYAVDVCSQTSPSQHILTANSLTMNDRYPRGSPSY